MYQHAAENLVIQHINPYITAKWCVGVAVASRTHVEILEAIRASVRHLISTSEDTYTSVLSEVNAIFNLGIRQFRYTNDPHAVELMYHPVELQRRVQRFGGRFVEDCESIAGWVLTCLLALGLKSRICVVAYDPFTYRHIFAEAYIPILRKWVAVDPSMGFRGRMFKVAQDTKKKFLLYPPTLNSPIRWEVQVVRPNGQCRTVDRGIDTGKDPLAFPRQFNPGVLSAPSLHRMTL